DAIIAEHLQANARRLGVTLENQTVSGRFSELIAKAAELHGQRAVVLIDEYDKPILDNLSAPEAAIEAREGLKNLYSVLKD
ncbi:AAA family ATPase, partial [Klebsiella pneumoniae]|uniref:AAA family ATPase n=1 Tax=Klebsiella pneumoniae TaxID=573 RepID=UPI002731D687